MSQYQIGLVVGSLRRESFNRKLANAVAKLAPDEFSFKSLEIGDLPMYNQDDDDNPAGEVKRLKREISHVRRPGRNRRRHEGISAGVDGQIRRLGEAAREVGVRE